MSTSITNTEASPPAVADNAIADALCNSVRVSVKRVESDCTLTTAPVKETVVSPESGGLCVTTDESPAVLDKRILLPSKFVVGVASTISEKVSTNTPVP